MTKEERQEREKAFTPEESITFNMLDKGTVDKLRRDGDIVLPKKKVDIPKDERWNTKQMSSKLLQGILNGDSIPKIAKSLTDIIGNNKASAERNARTMVTGAENAGRFDSYKNLESQGVVQKKIWMSTPDDRTRPTHVDIDGEEQDINDQFSNGCMYPGDGKGPAEEVWNCRCTMRDHIVGFKKADGSTSYVKGEEPNMSDDNKQANEREKSFAESLLDKEYSPHINAYKEVEDYWEDKNNYTGEKTDYVRDMFDHGKLNTESTWGTYDDKIPRIEATIAEMNKKYPVITTGDREYGMKINNLIICDYNNAWIYLPDGLSDRRLTENAAAQVFLNRVSDNSQGNTQAVMAFNRPSIVGKLKDDLENRAKAIKNGEVLSSLGYSPEITAMHEWGHIIDNHIDNAMIYQDEKAMEYWNWYKSLSKDEIRKGLSDYATTNRGEFAAECMAELQMSNPRPLALKFKEYLDYVIEKGY